MLPKPTTEVVVRDADSTIAIWDHDVVLQTRRGALNLTTLGRVRGAARKLLSSNRPIGALLVVEDGAPLPDESVRVAQRTFVAEILSNPSARIATVVLGTGVEANLARSSGRLVAVARSQVHLARDVERAAAWLAGQLTSLGRATSDRELFDAIEQMRESPVDR